MSHRFECTRCGRCCRRPGVIVLRDDEVATIARFLEVTAHELVADYGFRLDEQGWSLEVAQGEACVFLDGDACSIQDVKPVQCRTYPFWPEIVLEDGAWEEEAAHCPGIGIGREHDEDEVRAALIAVDSH